MPARDDRLFHPEFRAEPYWWDAWRPSDARGARDVPARADVALVGGGLTSLNAALELARAGVSCVVLEAGAFGSGASTRNGGGVSGGINVGKGLGGLKGETDEALLQAMVADAATSLDHLETVIAREAIACDYERSGRFAGAFTPAHHRAQAKQCDLLNAHARAGAWLLPRARLREEMASDFYYGGLVVERAGKIHPARYYGGLLDAAQRAGAVLVAGAPVTRIARAGGGWQLATPRGDLRAEKVFVGTNGYTGSATPALRRRAVPVASHMIATEELDPALAASLIPKGRFLSETKRVLCYYRLSPDGRRVLFGGRPRFTQVAPETSAALLHALMVERFPQLARIRITHNWMGNLAFAFDQLPHMGEIDGIHYAMCCNGSGVAMLGWLGQQSARKMLGGANRQNAFDGRSFSAPAFYTGTPWFLPLIGAWYRHLDRKDRRDAAREANGTQ
jgi:glycine/D-amino acid oxidase-like deaminating enzyme